MKIEITNRQRIKRISLKTLNKLLAKCARLLNLSNKKLSLVLVDNRLITDLNQRYFKKKTPTDVIAFALGDDLDPDYLGEVVVSVEEAVKIAQQLKISWQKELLLYSIHGILHLVGYDDRSQRKRQIMEKKQQELLNKLWLRKT